MLTRKQNQLLNFIQERIATTGISPSFEEMKDALNLKSKSGIHRLVSALEQREFLRRLPNRARALEVLRIPDAMRIPEAMRTQEGARGAETIANAGQATLGMVGGTPARDLPDAANSNDVVSLPLHGRIAAGVPIEAIEGHAALSVPAALLGPGEHYALEVSGDSMVDAGILDGDFALIRKSEVAREGEIVVALIDDQDATLKFFRREKGRIRLDPANSAYESQRYEPGQVRIQGRLAGLLRRY